MRCVLLLAIASMILSMPSSAEEDEEERPGTVEDLYAHPEIYGTVLATGELTGLDGKSHMAYGVDKNSDQMADYLYIDNLNDGTIDHVTSL